MVSPLHKQKYKNSKGVWLSKELSWKSEMKEMFVF